MLDLRMREGFSLASETSVRVGFALHWVYRRVGPYAVCVG